RGGAMTAPYRLAHSPEQMQARVPSALIELPQWVCWRSETRNSGTTKIPVNPWTGRKASSTDPHTWTSFAEAMAYHSRIPNSAGVGFVIHVDDPFVGVDLDNCIIDGALHPWAAK